MTNLFDLQPLELLCLQAIMQRKSLEAFAQDMTKLILKSAKKMQRNKQRRFTRFHAFQLRKSILKKLPSFKDALATNGQRKVLKA